MTGTWIKKVPTHYCNTPVVSMKPDFGIGSVWRCDGCEKEYVFRGFIFGWQTEAEYIKMVADLDHRPKKKERWWMWW